MSDKADDKFNWRAFLFPAAYFAGRGEIKKGIFLALLGSVPVVFFIVPFWAGFKAKNIQGSGFNWPKAIGVFLLHGFLLTTTINSIKSTKKTEVTLTPSREMSVTDICQSLVDKLKPSILRFNKLNAEIDERVALVVQKRFESESDKSYFRGAKRELSNLQEEIAGENMNEFLRHKCKEKGFKIEVAPK